VLLYWVSHWYCYAKCHYAEYCYADCYGAFDDIKLSILKRNTSESLKSFFVICVSLSNICMGDFMLAKMQAIVTMVDLALAPWAVGQQVNIFPLHST
jgi:hypothetical protein